MTDIEKRAELMDAFVKRWKAKHPNAKLPLLLPSAPPMSSLRTDLYVPGKIITIDSLQGLRTSEDD